MWFAPYFSFTHCPDPLGEFTALHQTSSWTKGPISKGNGGDGTERGRERQERERREGEGKGRKRRGG